MTGIFKANNPFNPFLLFIYGLALKFCWLIRPVTFSIHPEDGYLYKLLARQLLLVTSNSLLYFIAGYILLFIQAVMFNRLLNNLRMFSKPNYLPAMSYLLISSLLPEWNILSSSLLINSLIIWAFAKIYKLYNTQNPKTLVFDLGIIIGLISLLYFPALLLGVFMLIALGIVRPFKLQEWILALTGLVTPYYFMLAIIYLTNNFSSFRFQKILFRLPFFRMDNFHVMAYSLVLMICLSGAFFVQMNLRKQVVQVRKNWAIIFVYLLFSLSLAIFNTQHFLQYFLIVLPAAAAYAGASFLYISKRWVAELLHITLAGLVIYCSYFLK